MEINDDIREMEGDDEQWKRVASGRFVWHGLKEAYTLKLVYRGYKVNDADDEQDITHEPRE